MLSGFSQQVSTQAFRQQSETITIFTMLANCNNCQVFKRAADENNCITAATWLQGAKENVIHINAMEYYSAIKKTKLWHLQEYR